MTNDHRTRKLQAVRDAVAKKIPDDVDVSIQDRLFGYYFDGEDHYFRAPVLRYVFDARTYDYEMDVYNTVRRFRGLWTGGDFGGVWSDIVVMDQDDHDRAEHAKEVATTFHNSFWNCYHTTGDPDTAVTVGKEAVEILEDPDSHLPFC